MSYKTRFQAIIKHDELGEEKVITGSDKYVVQQKATKQLRAWDEKWRRHQERQTKQAKKDIAADLTKEANHLLQSLEKTLSHAFSINDKIDWESLKDYSDFPKPRIFQPNREDHKYIPKPGCLGLFIKSIKQKAFQDANALFQKDFESWQNWEDEKNMFFQKQAERNEIIEQEKQKYQQKHPSAIIAYCEMVLNQSNYPDTFPQKFEIEFNPENGVLIIEYQLPSLEDIPTLKEVKYIQSRDELKEIYISDADKLKNYDSLIYQITLRTIHEVFEADVVGAIKSIIFNGWIETINRSNGQKITPCIVSIQANQDDFIAINLAHVDPHACFKLLKGVSGAKMSNLTPIAPILTLNKQDKRFVDAYNVMDKIEQDYNLAIMDWEDFENLVRELFEKEFAQSGGEVKVTQASRDGGVDAVAFDPDPIRGGKIVIQAKRYTNVVDVSAVRDLYGTVLNEGATKGILITTSNFGADAYKFAQGKPLTLLTGNNLLHLLQKHGYKARIDINEAKMLLEKQSKQKNYKGN